jgi:hypothetical protein
MKYTVKIGEEFSEDDLREAQPEYRGAWTRARVQLYLTVVVVVCLLVALAWCAISGVYSGNFERLATVWCEGKVFLAVIIGLYFGTHKHI